MTAERESIRALATVTLDAAALDELHPATLDRLAALVEARLTERRAGGEEALLTPSAAAEIAGVHAETVRRAIRTGSIEVAGYVGTRARLRRAAVEEWVSSGRRLHPAPVGSGGIRTRCRRVPARRVMGDALDLGERAA